MLALRKAETFLPCRWTGSVVFVSSCRTRSLVDIVWLALAWQPTGAPAVS